MYLIVFSIINEYKIRNFISRVKSHVHFPLSKNESRDTFNPFDSNSF
jgi:hypothetical protein